MTMYTDTYTWKTCKSIANKPLFDSSDTIAIASLPLFQLSLACRHWCSIFSKRDERSSRGWVPLINATLILTLIPDSSTCQNRSLRTCENLCLNHTWPKQRPWNTGGTLLMCNPAVPHLTFQTRVYTILINWVYSDFLRNISIFIFQ